MPKHLSRFDKAREIFLPPVQKLISSKGFSVVGWEKLSEDPSYGIKAIRRDSDGQILSKGDNVYRETDAEKIIGVIKYFDIESNDVKVVTTQFTTHLYLIKKHS